MGKSVQQKFENISIMNTKLIIGNRNSRNLTRILVHRQLQQKATNIKNKKQNQIKQTTLN
jgi:hypothetical protein